MSFVAWLRKAVGPREPEKHTPLPPESLHCAFGPEETVCLQELSRLLARDSAGAESADIPLALGSLFRAQGDIDRAVALREMLLSLPEATPARQARIWFELGKDYRSAGLLDRAVYAYKEARRLGHPEAETGPDLVRLYADCGDFAAAADEASLQGMQEAQACYLVRQAEEMAVAWNDDAAARLLKKALAAYPGSPEACLAVASILLLGGNAEGTLKQLRAGLTKTTPPGRLILVEGLRAFTNGPSAPDVPAAALRDVYLGLSGVIADLDPDITLCYYAGLFLQQIRLEAEAEQWFTKTLVLDPEFWAARLALCALLAAREDLPPLLARQVAFFTEQAARSRRFLCRSCGMRRDAIFSECPRCRAWHSAAFRLRLT